MARVTLKGHPWNTNAELPASGKPAPGFKLTDAALADKTLDDYAGKKKLLSIVPSLDTEVCAISTIAFDKAAPDHADTVFLVISADLPFAQQRFSKERGLREVKTLSMLRNKNFAKDYGVLLQDGPLAGLTARAVLVLDKNNKIIYRQLVEEITHEPDYASALAALAD